MQVILDHIALVVESIDNCIKKLNAQNFIIGDVNEFPSEGTKEVYVSNNRNYGKLLLMEPISAGPYQKAIQKRGAGLHHIAINVQSIEKYLSLLTDSGWYLHLHSYESLKYNTAWLGRANTPLLIEVHEISDMADSCVTDFFINKIELNSNIDQKLLNSLKIKEIVKVNSEEMAFHIGDKAYKLSQLM